MAVLLLLAGGLVWGRCVLSEDRQAEKLAVAATALDAALGGDEAAWPRAEDAYGRAARGSLFDSYPLWVLEQVHVWRDPGDLAATGPLQLFLTAVRSRDYERAAEHAAALEEGRAREIAERLVAELRAARANRETADPNSR